MLLYLCFLWSTILPVTCRKKQESKKRLVFEIKRNEFLKWLNGVFQGQYLPSLRINYIVIKQRFGKITTTAVLYKEEKLSRSVLQWHQACHSNEMTPLAILLAAVFLRIRNFHTKILHRSFLDVREV